MSCSQDADQRCSQRIDWPEDMAWELTNMAIGFTRANDLRDRSVKMETTLFYNIITLSRLHYFISNIEQPLA